MNARELTRWAGTRHPDTEISVAVPTDNGPALLMEGDLGIPVEVKGSPTADALHETGREAQTRRSRRGRGEEE